MKYIYEDMRMIGMQDHHSQWWKVEKDCVKCGKCCMDMAGVTFPGIEQWVQENGACKFLDVSDEEVKPCLLYPFRPQGTCTNNNPHTMPDYCEMVLVKIDDPISLL